MTWELLNILGDIITHPLFRIGVPLLLAGIVFWAVKPKTFWPVIAFAVSAVGLEWFWLWYTTPLDCPLWATCEPNFIRAMSDYNQFWLPFVIAGIVAVLLLGWMARNFDRLTNFFIRGKA